MRRRNPLILLVLILIVAACGGDDKKQDAPPASTTGDAAWETGAATLDVERGRADVISAAQSQTVTPGAPVTVVEGDRITVSADGEATLTFFDGAQTRLTPGADVQVMLFRTAGESSQVELNVLVGQTISAVTRTLDASSSHTVRTPAATISVRGTEFVIAVRDAGLTQVTTVEGLVSVDAGGGSAEVPCGYGLKLAPGDAPGDLNVWGMAQVSVSAPLESMPDLPVVWVNAENGQRFYYRAGDMMALPLGSHDVIVESPGPYRVPGGVAFPEAAEPETPRDIAVSLGVVTLELLDDSGAPMHDAPMIVHLQQGDLAGETTVQPGDPILVGPGVWDVEVAMADQPEMVQHMEMTMGEGEAHTAQLHMRDFGGK